MNKPVADQSWESEVISAMADALAGKAEPQALAEAIAPAFTTRPPEEANTDPSLAEFSEVFAPEDVLGFAETAKKHPSIKPKQWASFAGQAVTGAIKSIRGSVSEAAHKVSDAASKMATKAPKKFNEEDLLIDDYVKPQVETSMRSTFEAAQKSMRKTYDNTIGKLPNAPKPAAMREAIADLAHSVNNAVWKTETISQQTEFLVNSHQIVAASNGPKSAQGASKQDADLYISGIRKHFHPRALENALIQIINDTNGKTSPAVPAYAQALKGRNASPEFVNGFEAVFRESSALVGINHSGRALAFLAAVDPQNGLKLTKSAKARIVNAAIDCDLPERTSVIGTLGVALAGRDADRALAATIKRRDFESAALLVANPNLSRDAVVKAVNAAESSSGFEADSNQQSLIKQAVHAHRDKFSNEDLNLTGPNATLLAKILEGSNLERSNLGRLAHNASENLSVAAQSTRQSALNAGRAISDAANQAAQAAKDAELAIERASRSAWESVRKATPNAAQIAVYAKASMEAFRNSPAINAAGRAASAVGNAVIFVAKLPIYGAMLAGSAIYKVGEMTANAAGQAGSAVYTAGQEALGAAADLAAIPVRYVYDNYNRVLEFSADFGKIVEKNKSNTLDVLRGLLTAHPDVPLSQKVADKVMMSALVRNDYALAELIAVRAQRMSPAVTEAALKMAIEHPKVAGAPGLFAAMSDARHLEGMPVSAMGRALATKASGLIAGRIFRAPEWADKLANFFENIPTAVKREAMKDPNIRSMAGFVAADNSQLTDASAAERVGAAWSNAKVRGNKIREELSPAGRASADRLFAAAGKSRNVGAMIELIANPRTLSALTPETIGKGIIPTLQANEMGRGSALDQGKKPKDTPEAVAIISTLLPALAKRAPDLHAAMLRQSPKLTQHVEKVTARIEAAATLESIIPDRLDKQAMKSAARAEQKQETKAKTADDLVVEYGKKPNTPSLDNPVLAKLRRGATGMDAEDLEQEKPTSKRAEVREAHKLDHKGVEKGEKPRAVDDNFVHDGKAPEFSKRSLDASVKRAPLTLEGAKETTQKWKQEHEAAKKQSKETGQGAEKGPERI